MIKRFCNKKYKYNFLLHTMNVVLENIPSCVAQLNDEQFHTDSYITDYVIDETDYFVASEINYHENYTVKMLKHIASYYGNLCISRMKKKNIVEFIIEFEQCESNFEIVQKRKRLWNHMEELLEDSFTRKFIISMNA